MIAVIILFFGLVISGVFVVRKLLERPLCTDNKQNGSETGIDCGGACALVCSAETVPLFVQWSRVVPVTEKVFSVVLEVENRNYDAVARNATYTCTVQTKDYRNVQKVSDAVYVPPAGRYYYTIPGLRFSSQDVRPERVSCSFDTRHDWLRLPSKTVPAPFDFQSVELVTGERPRLGAVVFNTDNTRMFAPVEVVAVIYDNTDTVVAVSNTIIDRLSPTQSTRIFFTWPQEFAGEPPYRAELAPVFEFPEYVGLP